VEREDKTKGKPDRREAKKKTTNPRHLQGSGHTEEQPSTCEGYSMKSNVRCGKSLKSSAKGWESEGGSAVEKILHFDLGKFQTPPKSGKYKQGGTPWKLGKEKRARPKN